MTLAVTVLGSVLFRGFLAIIPILIGVLVGYALSFFMGVVDLTPIREAHWFALPTFYTPRFEWFAIFTIPAGGAGGDRRARRPLGGDRQHREKT